jgi:hypothetical protein
MEEWMLAGFSRQREQVCSKGRPRRLAGEVGDDLVGLAVEHLNDLRSNEVLGRPLEAVGVALHCRVEPGSRVGEFSQQCRGGGGVSSRARICCKVSVGVRAATVSGRMMLCGSPSPTTCR